VEPAGDGERESLVARGNSGEPGRRMPGARRGAEELEGRVAGGEIGGRGGEDGRAVTMIALSWSYVVLDFACSCIVDHG